MTERDEPFEKRIDSDLRKLARGAKFSGYLAGLSQAIRMIERQPDRVVAIAEIRMLVVSTNEEEMEATINASR